MDIYDELLNIINNEKNIEEVLTKENKWEYLYHLSNIRRNILEWYTFEQESRLLEIDAECGAITGLFCERVKSVVAIEKDQKMCKVNSARNGAYENLDIINAGYKEAEVDDYSFDYVTIIGKPTSEKIRFAVSKLKKGGKLIVAFDNKYGVKNWASVVDDNGVIKSNIQELLTEEDSELSREKIEGIIKGEGINSVECYYPVPEYVLPLEIYNEDNIPKSGLFVTATPTYMQDQYIFFDEVKVIDGIIKDGLFDKFANSFILICE